MFFDSWSDIGRVAVVSMLAYAALVLILRLAGKRSLAKFNIFDFAITVAFGSTLSAVLLNRDVSLAEGVLAFVMLAGLQWVVSSLSVRMHWFKRLVRSEPRLLLRDGEFMDEAMRQERITRGEIEAAIRMKGHGGIQDIAAVVLETSGEMSVVARNTAGDGAPLRALEGFERG